MSKRSWSVLLGPPLVVLGAIVAASWLLGATNAGARVSPSALAACRSLPVIAATGKPGSWWKLDPELDGSGTLVGRRLVVGAGNAAGATVTLPPESAASGPVGGVIVVASDDGSRSTISLVSAVAGCSSTVHETSAVVRGVILDAVRGSVLAHLVERGTRADLGTWRIELGDGATTKAVRVAAPLDPEPRKGPVFTTELRLDRSSTRIAVQSCFEAGCLSRVFDLARPGSEPLVLEGDAQGTVLGFADDALVAWDACPGLPCGVSSWHFGGGTPKLIADSVRGAALTADARYVVVTTNQKGRTLRIDLRTGETRQLRGVAAGEAPIPVGQAAMAGLEVGPAEVALGGMSSQARAFDPSAAEVLP